MTENDNTFRGFEAIADFMSNPSGFKKEDDNFEDIPFKDPSELKEDETESIEDTKPIESKGEKNEIKLPDRSAPVIKDKTIEEILEEDTTEEKTEKEETTTEPEEKIEEDETSKSTSDLDELEPDITAFFQEKLYEKLGWEFGEGEEKLKSVDEVIDYMQSLVEENSKPDYADPEIAELNQFVLNGGSIKNYFDTKYAGEIDIESADIEDPIIQSRVIKEFYKEQGLSEDKITKRIQRFEDTGVLEDEAKDAKEILLKTKTEKAKKLLVEQQNLRAEAEKQQQKLYEDVANSIRSTKEILGVSITQAEKEKLIKDIFVPGSDGKTNYQKKYQSSIDNLIKSAFFTMYEDKLSQKVNNKATSEAATSLKKKLQATKTGLRARGSDMEDNTTTNKKGNTDAFSSISGYLQKPTK